MHRIKRLEGMKADGKDKWQMATYGTFCRQESRDVTSVRLWAKLPWQL